MTDTNHEDQKDAPKKKVNLQEAIKQQLERKKQQAAAGKASYKTLQTTKTMKSQQTKKVNNQRKRMGI
ncbi:hypothetical protein [Halalkalibacterium ligniniphilum]|uniref:hypothetical protein n=1 Tax=Halalkalibacterium ligniniphilum TaxID=1134413 RepID=UPI00034C760D|nr:hypothetical protein [Halalkalibacterium ligniniphilum]